MGQKFPGCVLISLRELLDTVQCRRVIAPGGEKMNGTEVGGTVSVGDSIPRGGGAGSMEGAM